MNAIGETNSFLQPYVRIVLRGNFGREQTVEARMDTGFDRALALPPSTIAALGLEYVTERPMILADGREEAFLEYRSRVMWEGFERPIRVLAKPGKPLVGVALFQGYRVLIEFIDGGLVEAEAI